MKKYLFAVLALFLTTGSLTALPVNVERAKYLGCNFMKTTSLGLSKTPIQLYLVHTFASERGAANLYAFNIRGGGFVILSADDRVKPVLAYSTQGRFDANGISDGLRLQLNGYQEEIGYVREHDIAATPDIVAEWASVAQSGRPKATQGSRNVGPLVETTWHQNKFYNSQCPEDPNGPDGHVFSGCVACAMSQVMRYWNHPIQGEGSHSYTPGIPWGQYVYPTQTANFGETYYHFERMPFVLDSTSTEEDVFYVAQLQHHCGISVDMSYGPNVSESSTNAVPDALHTYFGYSESHVETKGPQTNEEWAAMLKAELDGSGATVVLQRF